jgi:hypothetical protein
MRELPTAQAACDVHARSRERRRQHAPDDDRDCEGSPTTISHTLPSLAPSHLPCRPPQPRPPQLRQRWCVADLAWHRATPPPATRPRTFEKSKGSPAKVSPTLLRRPRSSPFARLSLANHRPFRPLHRRRSSSSSRARPTSAASRRSSPAAAVSALEDLWEGGILLCRPSPLPCARRARAQPSLPAPRMFVQPVRSAPCGCAGCAQPAPCTPRSAASSSHPLLPCPP